MVHIGGTLHLRSEIDAVNVDVTSTGFDGVLSNGDNTVQKALQKIDDTHEVLTYNPTVKREIHSGSGVTLTGGWAVRMGDIVFFRVLVNRAGPTRSLYVYIDPPVSNSYMDVRMTAGNDWQLTAKRIDATNIEIRDWSSDNNPSNYVVRGWCYAPQ